jgi:hypothetical protein
MRQSTIAQLNKRWTRKMWIRQVLIAVACSGVASLITYLIGG